MLLTGCTHTLAGSKYPTWNGPSKAKQATRYRFAQNGPNASAFSKSPVKMGFEKGGVAGAGPRDSAAFELQQLHAYAQQRDAVVAQMEAVLKEQTARFRSSMQKCQDELFD